MWKGDEAGRRESHCKNDLSLKKSVEMLRTDDKLGTVWVLNCMCVELKGAFFKTDSHLVLWQSPL